MVKRSKPVRKFCSTKRVNKWLSNERKLCRIACHYLVMYIVHHNNNKALGLGEFLFKWLGFSYNI